MKVRWNILQDLPQLTTQLAEQLQISRLLARLLIERGLDTPAAAAAFLNPRLEDLHDPGLLKDMDRVVDRVFEARSKGEKVLIYGDYDVDGITSTVVLKRALEMLGVAVDFHIPQRLKDGYGLRTEVIRQAHERGYSVVISADSGIRAFEVCEVAGELGLDLIVTDHHLPADTLPCAYAIVNPHRPDCTYPDKNLAAVGVVFKVVHALFKKAGKEHLIHHFLKLVAIGTIADVVPLTGENRIIVKYGLEGLAQPQNTGLRALLEGAGVGARVDPFDVGFKVAPRINAVTRMGGGREVVDLFSVGDRAVAEAMVGEMNRKNLLRREEEDRILAEIEERFQDNPESFAGNFLVVRGKDWHRGVIGIVASRLVDRFYRPVLVLSDDGKGCQGSGRSIPGFHLLKALDSCRDFLGQYGGHEQAVGCSFTLEPGQEDQVEQLARRLESHAVSVLRQDQLLPTLRIESVLPVEEVSFSFMEQIERLAPFGVGNPVPVFASRGARVAGGPWILKDRHLKMRLQRNGSWVDAIWWRKAEFAEKLDPTRPVDVAYTVGRNVYQGQESLVLTIRDILQSRPEQQPSRFPIAAENVQNLAV